MSYSYSQASVFLESPSNRRVLNLPSWRQLLVCCHPLLLLRLSPVPCPRAPGLGISCSPPYPAVTLFLASEGIGNLCAQPPDFIKCSFTALWAMGSGTRAGEAGHRCSSPGPRAGPRLVTCQAESHCAPGRPDRCFLDLAPNSSWSPVSWFFFHTFLGISWLLGLDLPSSLWYMRKYN